MSAFSNIGQLEKLVLPKSINNADFYITLSKSCNLQELIIPTSSRAGYETGVCIKQQGKVEQLIFPEGITCIEIDGDLKNISKIQLPSSVNYITGRPLLYSATQFVISPKVINIAFVNKHWDYTYYFQPFIVENISLKEKKEIQDFWRNYGYDEPFGMENLFRP